MRSEEPTVLDANEAALVTADGEFQLFMPKLSESEMVPHHMMRLTACFVRLNKDPAFLEDLDIWLEENFVLTRLVKQ